MTDFYLISIVLLAFANGFIVAYCLIRRPKNAKKPIPSPSFILVVGGSQAEALGKALEVAELERMCGEDE